MKKFLIFASSVMMLVQGCSGPDVGQLEDAHDASADVSQIADVVFTNANVYTVNEQQPFAEAVAIKGNSIIYVGSANDARGLIGDLTIVHDLEGKMLLPGFISAHDHPIDAMAQANGLTLEINHNKQNMLDGVKAYFKEHPDGPYFGFGGAFEKTVAIHRRELDAITGDKPFFITAGTGHGGWANSKALELAGVVKGQPQPIDYFGLDEDGTPNGFVGTAAAAGYMERKITLHNETEAVIAASAAIMSEIASLGVTGIFEASILIGAEEERFAGIEELEAQGKLTVRLIATCQVQRDHQIDETLDCLRKYGTKYNSEFFNVTALKIHGDGAFEGHTAALLEPYSDKPGELGVLSLTPPETTRVMLETAKLGYDIHAHAIGDRAIRVILDSFEAVRDAGYDDTRLSIGHTMLISDEDFPRLKTLDVIANFYGLEQAQPNPLYLARLGEDRYNTLTRMGSLTDAGVRITLSADYPTLPLSPWIHMSSRYNTHSSWPDRDYRPGGRETFC